MLGVCWRMFRHIMCHLHLKTVWWGRARRRRARRCVCACALVFLYQVFPGGDACPRKVKFLAVVVVLMVRW